MNYEIKQAGSSADFAAIEKLTYREYLQQEFITPNQEEAFTKHRPWNHLSETGVFVAESEGSVVGTISITVDNPSGFSVDMDFPEEVTRMKKECKEAGKTLGYSWRIVTDSNYKDRKLVFYLIKRVIEYICEKNIQVMLYEFHPKHVAFYQKLLGFSVVSERDEVVIVRAPGVLMKSDTEDLLAKWKRVCSKLKIPYTGDK